MLQSHSLLSACRPFRCAAQISIAALSLAVAVLSGCSSKNPLIDEPTQATTPRKATVTKPGAPSTESVPSTARTEEQTTIKRLINRWFSPYKIDVQQGNFISREMVAQLKEGIQRPEGVTREQVKFVMGTPLLTDVFHADRWDYIFRLKKGTGEEISSRLTVLFNAERVSSIVGGEDLPTETEYLTFISGQKK